MTTRSFFRFRLRPFPSSRRVALLPTVAAALVLSACSGPRYTHVLPVSPTQETGAAYGYVASLGGPMVVEVYAPPPSATADDIAAAFPAPSQYSPIPFVTALPPEARKDLAAYRFVLVFSAPVAFDGDDACTLRSAPAAAATARQGGGGDLLAAFCRGEDNLRQVRVSGDGLDFPGGAKAAPAQAILSQISGYLVPRCNSGTPRGAFMPTC